MVPVRIISRPICGGHASCEITGAGADLVRLQQSCRWPSGGHVARLGRVLAYALTIFTGAFLLFQVQPLIGKYILPWFGGGPGVWTTCMLFFQAVLLGGYAYAHVTTRWLKPRVQAVVHLGLLVAALALLPITPSDSWKPQDVGHPALRILVLLAVSLGIPYFVLSSTGPLMQQWFTRTHPGASPYRLYALSNFGSLLALLSYPFWFETQFARKTQAAIWGWGLVAYAICCGFCAARLWGQKPKSEARNQESGGRGREPAPAVPSTGHQSAATDPATLAPRPSPLDVLLWLLLPACASVLLLATTNKLCLDVAVVPFLWVAPLALYLLSFIICFDSPRWYARFPFALALVGALAFICQALYQGADWSLWRQAAVYCGGLFICCMVCHGELYRLRPHPRYLTGFYLMIAAGGALGGLLVAVVAPLVFNDYYEFQAGLFLCGLLFLAVCVTEGLRETRSAKCEVRSADCGVSESRSQEPGVGSQNPESRILDPQPGSGTSLITDHKASSTRPSRDGWRWLAVALTVAAFAGLDRLAVWLGGQSKADYHGWFIALRIGLWTLLALAAGWWVVRGLFRSFRHWHWVACGWVALGLAALGTTLWMQTRDSDGEIVSKSRSFYGVLTVYEHRRNDPLEHHFLLMHGRITHGLQFVDPEQAAWPTSYYTEGSGAALAVKALPPGPRRIGVVGLGTGTFAAFGRSGDYVRVYEINPEVQRIANSPFTYLANCRGKVEVALGDARLSLERESPQRFDLLALDAFSSDSIPVHLLTREAFAVYERHLNPNGIIAVHISNHYLDLEPVVANLAREFNYCSAIIDQDELEDEWWVYGSTWILLTHSQAIIDSPAIREAAASVKPRHTRVPLWTDDFTSLFQILK